MIMTKRYVIGYLFIIFAFLLFFLPIGILFFIKYDEWVIKVDGFELSMGLLIGITYAFLVFKGALRTVSNKFSIIITLAVFSAIFYFFDGIINDLFLISVATLVGAILFLVFNAIGKRQIEIARIYTDEQIKMIARANPRQPSNTLNAIK
jgi:hypothetical protein